MLLRRCPALLAAALPATLVLSAAAALPPASAPAATVSRDGSGVLVYTASPGERNDLSVQTAYDEVSTVLYDSNGYITAAPPDCVLDDMFGESNKVTCAVAPPAVRLDLGDGDEWATVSSSVKMPVTMLGGPGNDRLELSASGGTLDGGPDDDILNGYPGNDTLLGGDGQDTLEGGAGSDHVDGGPGDDLVSGDGYEGQYADVIDGGPGNDRIEIDWSSRVYDYVQPPVAVTLGGGADDGRPGEGDDVRNVEHLDLNIAVDVTGTDAAETLEFHQMTRSMTIDARGGDDTVQAGEGADTVRGGAGDDTLDASFGDDTIDPGPGRDTVYADLRGGDCGPFWCTLPYGNDTVLARDGEIDSISCGVGTDRVVADADDVVSPDCEAVERSAAPVRRGDVIRRHPRGATLRAIAPPRLPKALARGLVVRVERAAPRVEVTLKGRAGKRVVARGSARASTTGVAKVTLRFSKAAQRNLRHAKKVRLAIAGAGTGTVLTLHR
jgi:hypothetical protein